MKRYLSIWLTALALRTLAQVNLSVEIHATADFEAPLAASGPWVEVGRFGRCWHPAGIPADWRPYGSGEWVWTDCGWYWSSDEPWAWACYHYGTWVDDPAAGWIWVPGIEWSPAWVIWRTGGGYVGWAPCAPPGVVVAPALFAFVEIGHFGDPVRRDLLLVNDPAIIRKTKEIRQVRSETRDIGAGHAQKITINEGPNVADVEKAAGKKFGAAPIAQAVRHSSLPHSLTPRPPPEIKPGIPQKPATPVSPQRPITPDKPVTPAPPVTPAVPRKPETPGTPGAPTKPEEPTRPTPPGRPTTPGGGSPPPAA